MIRPLLHAVDPYKGFLPHPNVDLQGWNSDKPIFCDLINEVKPSLIIEVGSWKGTSAIHMAECCDLLMTDMPEILCIDTWLGADEFWEPEDKLRYEGLRLINGYPHVHLTFMSNV